MLLTCMKIMFLDPHRIDLCFVAPLPCIAVDYSVLAFRVHH